MNGKNVFRATARIAAPTLVAAAAVLANVGPAVAATPEHIQPAAVVKAVDPNNVCTFTSSRFVAHLKDGRSTVVETSGNTVSGSGNVYLTLDHPTEFDTTQGTATGKAEDYKVTFTVTPRYGTKTEEYIGFIMDTGAVDGWVQNGPSWKADAGSVKCSKHSVAATSTVTDDVDLYTKPGGDDQFKVGFLKKGTVVNTMQGKKCPANDWCEVIGPNVPGNDGYVWGSFAQDYTPSSYTYDGQ